MSTPYSYQLKHGPEGRITEKSETVSGKTIKWTYAYDKQGRLTEAKLDGKLGRRSQGYFPKTAKQVRNYRYTMDNRLLQAGNNGYTHDKQGFRSLWNSGGKYTSYEYAPDYRLLKVTNEPDNTVYEFAHDDNGQRKEKLCNGELVEAYKWLDFTRLAGFHDGESSYEFVYNDKQRTPHTLLRDNGDEFHLFYDNLGSLRVVADTSGNVIKENLYDPFGGIIADSNPDMRIPIGFAGGLYDPDLGFIRFGWRDYDPFTSRWTAPDPMGDAGGDDDWYGYCLDDPVNMVDPLGLMGSKPEEPEEVELYPADKSQWQAQPERCGKCGELDGNYYSFGAAPDDPHPNCNCELVECFYGSEYTKWEEHERSLPEYDYPDPVVLPFSLNVVPILWTKTIEIIDKRTRTSFILCGDRKDILEAITEYRKREEEFTAYSNANRSQDSTTFWTNNPWVKGDTRYGTIQRSY